MLATLLLSLVALTSAIKPSLQVKIFPETFVNLNPALLPITEKLMRKDPMPDIHDRKLGLTVDITNVQITSSSLGGLTFTFHDRYIEFKFVNATLVTRMHIFAGRDFGVANLTSFSDISGRFNFTLVGDAQDQLETNLFDVDTDLVEYSVKVEGVGFAQTLINSLNGRLKGTMKQLLNDAAFQSLKHNLDDFAAKTRSFVTAISGLQVGVFFHFVTPPVITAKDGIKFIIGISRQVIDFGANYDSEPTDSAPEDDSTAGNDSTPDDQVNEEAKDFEEADDVLPRDPASDSDDFLWNIV